MYTDGCARWSTEPRHRIIRFCGRRMNPIISNFIFSRCVLRNKKAEEEMPEPEIEMQPIHTYQRRREFEPVKKSQKSEEEKQSQKDAELLMEVISDVF